MLSYPDFLKEFVQETDASLNCLGAVLLQLGSDRKGLVIVYARRSLHPLERSMQNYNSAKLELLALKWAVMEKFWDYLLESKFTMYTDNSPLAYVQESKLGVCQIRWLSKLAFLTSRIFTILGGQIDLLML